MLGYSEHELLSLSIMDIHPQEDVPAVLHVFQKQVAERYRVAEDLPVLRKDGSVFYADIAPSLLTYQDRPCIMGIFRDITERKNAQAGFRQVSERLSLATKAANVGIWDLDVPNRKLIWDDSMFRLYGITPNDFAGAYEAWQAGVHPQDLPRVEAEVRMALRGEKEFDTEFRVLWPDKSVHWLRAHAMVRYDALGKPVRMLGTNWDITERKHAEEAIRANLEIQSALAALLRLSLDHLALEELLGRALDLLLGLPWIQLQSKAAIFLVADEPQTLLMKVQRGLPESVLHTCHKVPFGRCLCGEAADHRRVVFAGCVADDHVTRYPGLTPHGHYCLPIISEDTVLGVINLYVNEGHQRSPLEEGFLTAVADVLAGIVKRRRAEEALRKSEERFDLAIRGTDAGIWDWDLLTNQCYFSPRWKSMLGYEDREIRDHFSEWETRFHPDDREQGLKILHECLDGRTSDYEFEHRLQHKAGFYRWILARGAVVRDPSGKPYRMVGSHLDITDRKLAEQLIRERERELISAQRIQEHLLPLAAPSVSGFDIAGSVLPAEYTAGDFYDYLFMPDGSLGVVVGDVSRPWVQRCVAYGGNQRPPAVVRAGRFGHCRHSAACERPPLSRDRGRPVCHVDIRANRPDIPQAELPESGPSFGLRAWAVGRHQGAFSRAALSLWEYCQTSTSSLVGRSRSKTMTSSCSLRTASSRPALQKACCLAPKECSKPSGPIVISRQTRSSGVFSRRSLISPGCRSRRMT